MAVHPPIEIVVGEYADSLEVGRVRHFPLVLMERVLRRHRSESEVSLVRMHLEMIWNL